MRGISGSVVGVLASNEGLFTYLAVGFEVLMKVVMKTYLLEYNAV
jgi:hypothetical protein